MLIQETDYLEHYGRLGMKWYEHRFGKEDGRAMYEHKMARKWAKTKKKIDKTVEKREKWRKSNSVGGKIKTFGDDLVGDYRSMWRGRRGTQSKDIYEQVNKVVDDYFKAHVGVPVVSRVDVRWLVQEYLGGWGEVPSTELVETLYSLKRG